MDARTVTAPEASDSADFASLEQRFVLLCAVFCERVPEGVLNRLRRDLYLRMAFLRERGLDSEAQAEVDALTALSERLSVKVLRPLAHAA